MYFLRVYIYIYLFKYAVFNDALSNQRYAHTVEWKEKERRKDIQVSWVITLNWKGYWLPIVERICCRRHEEESQKNVLHPWRWNQYICFEKSGIKDDVTQSNDPEFTNWQHECCEKSPFPESHNSNEFESVKREATLSNSGFCSVIFLGKAMKETTKFVVTL